jgi:hypothetical protein
VEGSKKITSVMMVVAIATLALLALTTGRDGQQPEAPQPLPEPLPGLHKNLQAVERITGFPYRNIRSVIITRSNDEQLTVIKDEPETPNFSYLDDPPPDIAPFSAILFANASFLDALASADTFVVSGAEEELRLGSLKYTSFDGLVLELIVFRSGASTKLRMIAAYSNKLASRYADSRAEGLLAANTVQETARRLNGRVYAVAD